MKTKKAIHKAIRISILFILMGLSYSSIGQPPPPPGGSSGGGGGTGGTSGQRNGAPIGGGLLILLSLGATYAGYKVYKLYQEKKRSLID